jgi:hypothetical protein
VQSLEVGPGAEPADVFVPIEAVVALETEVQWFKPLKITNERLRVKPLLSPAAAHGHLGSRDAAALLDQDVQPFTLLQFPPNQFHPPFFS